METIDKIGHIGNGKSQSRTVYTSRGLCPTLCSGMEHCNTMPYIIEIKEVEKESVDICKKS